MIVFEDYENREATTGLITCCDSEGENRVYWL